MTEHARMDSILTIILTGYIPPQMTSHKHDTLMVEHGTFVQSVVEMGDGLLRIRMTRISHLLTLFDQIEGSFNLSDIVLIKI